MQERAEPRITDMQIASCFTGLVIFIAIFTCSLSVRNKDIADFGCKQRLFCCNVTASSARSFG